MNCYGQYHNCPPEKCEFAASCRYYRETRSAMNQQLGGQDFDRLAAWAPDLAAAPAAVTEWPTGAKPGLSGSEVPQTTEDFAEFLRFLLHLDDYTLGVLAEIIAPQNLNGKRRRSVAELARMRGISRQGMHRKTLRIARRYPELASLLGLTVKKIRNARAEFTTPAARQTPPRRHSLATPNSPRRSSPRG